MNVTPFISSRLPALAWLLLAAALASCGGGGASSNSTNASSPKGVRLGPSVVDAKAWRNLGNDAQHSGLNGGAPVQALGHVLWSSDLSVPGSPRLAASPVITSGDTVIVSVNTHIDTTMSPGTSAYVIEARDGASGQVRWKSKTDYQSPPVSPFRAPQPALSGAGRVWFPGAGGKLYFRDNADDEAGTVKTVVFYGSGAYDANPALYDKSVYISTPLVVDGQGTVYFGYTSSLHGLPGGVARIDTDGNGSWVSAAQASSDAIVTDPAPDSAPAVSPDGKTVYLAVYGRTLQGPNFHKSYLLGLDSATLQTRHKAPLREPASHVPANLVNHRFALSVLGQSASPVVGPDGDVYISVWYTDSFPAPTRRHGWLLHFDATLGRWYAPGYFGQGMTPSLVPSSMVAGYGGSSAYLLASPFHDAFPGANAIRRMAILDPKAEQMDHFHPTLPVMKEVIKIDTPPPLSWNALCGRSSAVDPATASVYFYDCDGHVRGWNLTSNLLTQSLAIGGQESTSGATAVTAGPDGKLFVPNHRSLMVIGQ